jgi:hypothetical protein
MMRIAELAAMRVNTTVNAMTRTRGSFDCSRFFTGEV